MVDLQDAPPEPVHGSERPLNFELSMLGLRRLTRCVRWSVSKRTTSPKWIVCRVRVFGVRQRPAWSLLCTDYTSGASHMKNRTSWISWSTTEPAAAKNSTPMKTQNAAALNMLILLEQDGTSIVRPARQVVMLADTLWLFGTPLMPQGL